MPNDMTPPNAQAPLDVMADRRLRLGVHSHVMLSHAARTLMAMQPQTATGRLALNLVAQTSISLLSVSAITGYVYAITETDAPQVTFRGDPPGPGINNKELQEAYNDFRQQYASFQAHAGAWVNTDPASGGASIFSQLVSVPRTFGQIAGAVEGKFTILRNTPPGSPAYESAMSDLKALIGAELPDINTLKTAMEALGTTLQDAAVSLKEAAATGVLKQLQDAYAAEIQSLTDCIKHCQQQIDSDNAKIVGLGFASAAAIAVGLVGLANIWNPFGWIMIAGGAVGAYFAISEILRLKGEIASLKAKIQNSTLWREDDTQAAATVATFSNQVQGFGSLNDAAQKELTTLETLYQSLADDINTAISDLDAGDLDQAENEWGEVMAAAAPLAQLTAYIWPSSVRLPDPTDFSATGDDVYAIDNAGKPYKYTKGANTWTELPDHALSIVASGWIVAAIDGAPLDGSKITPDPVPASYKVKTYSADTNRWTTISDFAAAAISVAGGEIYAIKQQTDDRQVYKYNGSGTAWTKLADLPGPDAASQIAAVSDYVYAVTNNSQTLYSYNGVEWSKVMDASVASIQANNDRLAVITSDMTLHLVDTDGTTTEVAGSVIGAAQTQNKNQFFIKSDTLELAFADNEDSPPSVTDLKPDAVGVYASDTNEIYYADKNGDVFRAQYAGSTGLSWTQLPALPA
ncbi:MAG: hypothetical protein ACLFQ5_06275 [Oceanicaulis sp.]